MVSVAKNLAALTTISAFAFPILIYGHASRGVDLHGHMLPFDSLLQTV